MKKTIFIHIDPHKTGTTSIQHGLAANENKLIKIGILAPKTGRPHQLSAGNHNLAWELRKEADSRFNPEFGTWNDLIKECRNQKDLKKIILSSEDFSILTKGEISEIKEILSRFQVKIIIYLRRQDKSLQSTWVEVVRNGGTPGIVPHFNKWVKDNNYSSSNTDYLKIIKEWEAVFSKKSIILKIFDPSQFKGSLFEDFLASCEVTISDLVIPPKANVSPGVKTIEAIRFVKSKIDFSNFNKRNWNYLVNCIVEYGNQNGWNQKKINLIDNKLSETIMAHHNKKNQEIANEYLKQTTLFNLEKINNSVPTHFNFSEFSKDDITKLFSFLLGEFDDKLSKDK